MMHPPCYVCLRTDVKKARHWCSFGELVAICRGCEAKQLRRERAEMHRKRWSELALEMAEDSTYLTRYQGG